MSYLLDIGTGLSQDEAWPPRHRYVRNRSRGIPTKGPEWFIEAVRQALNDIARLPNRLREVLNYLPQIVYVEPSIPLDHNQGDYNFNGEFFKTQRDWMWGRIRQTVLQITAMHMYTLNYNNTSWVFALHYSLAVERELGYYKDIDILDNMKSLTRLDLDNRDIVKLHLHRQTFYEEAQRILNDNIRITALQNTIHDYERPKLSLIKVNIGADIPSEEAYPPRDRTSYNQTYGIPVKGPDYFVQAVLSVLQDLEGLPHRSKEMMAYMPRIVYGENLYARDGTKVVGLDSGLIEWDENDFPLFRETILHELGHNIAEVNCNDGTEYSAIVYSNRVLDELGYPHYKEPTQEQYEIWLRFKDTNLTTQSRQEVAAHTTETVPHKITQVSDRTLGTYVIGKTGTGKSTLLLNMIIDDINSSISTIVIDPHGQLVDDITERVQLDHNHTILLDPTDYNYPFGLNLFELDTDPNPLSITQSSDKVASIIKKAWLQDRDASWGGLIEELIPQVARVFVQVPGTPYTLSDTLQFLENEEFRKSVLREADDDQLTHYWSENYNPRTAEPTLRRFRRFVGRPIIENIFGQSYTTIDYSRLIDGGFTLLVKLNPHEIGATTASLIGQVLIDKVLTATFKRSRVPEDQRQPFSLYIDEFHVFSTPQLEEMFTGVRKYGAQVVVAHQTRDQLDRNIRSAVKNAGNIVCFGVHSDDARDMAGEFSSRYFEQQQELLLPIMRKPLDALLHKRHFDERVSNFVDLHARPLIETANRLESEVQRNRRQQSYLGPEHHPLWGIQEMMNSFLYNGMTKKLSQTDKGANGRVRGRMVATNRDE